MRFCIDFIISHENKRNHKRRSLSLNSKTAKRVCMALALSFLATPVFAEPISYGHSELKIDEPKPSQQPTEDQQRGQQEEGGIDATKEDEALTEEDINNNDGKTTYSRTEVVEKVPYYMDGKIVKQRSLKKVIKGRRTSVDGKDGWYIEVAEEYVKYWNRTERQRVPIVGVRKGHKFYPDDENGNQVDLDSL